MTSSFLTVDEIYNLNETDLHRKGPFLICGVTQSQLSVARHYGGCKFNIILVKWSDHQAWMKDVGYGWASFGPMAVREPKTELAK